MLVGDDPREDVGEVGVRPSQQSRHRYDSASARSRSARRLTVIGRGLTVRAVPQRPRLAPVKQPARERVPLPHLPRLGLPASLVLGPLDQA